MVIESKGHSLRLFGAIFDGGTVAGLSDGQLLERFAEGRDQAAEVAFEVLVRRHGPMVLRVCRAALRDEHDAQDAFQATFLVLVFKAASLRVRDSLGPWLHAVALRISARARVAAARRRTHERRRVAMPARSPEVDAGDDRDAVLHEEVGRLPERFRKVVVLCDLGGMTHQEASRQLGWPVGTVKSRQRRGRERLRARLVRRGLAPSAGCLAVALTEKTASATVPVALAEATIQLAMRVLLGKAAMAGLASPPVVGLVDAGLRTMLLSTMKLVAVTTLAASLLATGAAVVAYSAWSRESRSEDGQGKDRAQDPIDKARGEPPRARAHPGQSGPVSRTPEEELLALLQEYDRNYSRVADALKGLNPGAKRQALLKQLANDLDRFKGRFLDLALRHPRTNVAEQALVWLARHAATGPEGDRARAILARDHARGDRLGALFGPAYDGAHQVFSHSAEDLLRNALDQNPLREIRGLACYWLADFLTYQAESLRLFQLDDPAELEERLAALKIKREDADGLLKKDPRRLEDEATLLYERVIAEFPGVANNDIRYNFAPPLQLGKAAMIPLEELRRLSVGKAAPPVEGVDLEGRPMRLSDYRGKVVVLFAEARVPLRGGHLADMRILTKTFPSLARKMEGRPLALFGVVSGDDRESFTKAVQADVPTARFWWDPDHDGKPGPLRAAWGANVPNVYVIDPRGVIRYTGLRQAHVLDKAVTRVLKEWDAEQARGREGK